MAKRPITKREDPEQRAFFQWLGIRFPDIFEVTIHIPNGGSRHPIEAANLKRAGVKAGVSDIFVAFPVNNKHGLWIEMKAPKTKTYRPRLSDEQRKWLEKMRSLDYAAYVAFGWENASEILVDYIG